MSSEVLDKIAEQKKVNEIQFREFEEYFKDQIREYKERKLELTPEQIYLEISNIYKLVFTLWDDVINWKYIVAVQDEMMVLYKDISNIPNPKKQDLEIEPLKRKIQEFEEFKNQILKKQNQETETIRKRIEELEEFKKHIIESVANKPIPNETKPHEGMYE